MDKLKAFGRQVQNKPAKSQFEIYQKQNPVQQLKISVVDPLVTVSGQYVGSVKKKSAEGNGVFLSNRQLYADAVFKNNQLVSCFYYSEQTQIIAMIEQIDFQKKQFLGGILCATSGRVAIAVYEFSFSVAPQTPPVKIRDPYAGWEYEGGVAIEYDGITLQNIYFQGKGAFKYQDQVNFQAIFDHDRILELQMNNVKQLSCQPIVQTIDRVLEQWSQILEEGAKPGFVVSNLENNVLNGPTYILTDKRFYFGSIDYGVVSQLKCQVFSQQLSVKQKNDSIIKAQKVPTGLAVCIKTPRYEVVVRKTQEFGIIVYKGQFFYKDGCFDAEFDAVNNLGFDSNSAAFISKDRNAQILQGKLLHTKFEGKVDVYYEDQPHSQTSYENGLEVGTMAASPSPIPVTAQIQAAKNQNPPRQESSSTLNTNPRKKAQTPDIEEVDMYSVPPQPLQGQIMEENLDDLVQSIAKPEPTRLKPVRTQGFNQPQPQSLIKLDEQIDDNLNDHFSAKQFNSAPEQDNKQPQSLFQQPQQQISSQQTQETPSPQRDMAVRAPAQQSRPVNQQDTILIPTKPFYVTDQTQPSVYQAELQTTIQQQENINALFQHGDFQELPDYSPKSVAFQQYTHRSNDVPLDRSQQIREATPKLENKMILSTQQCQSPQYIHPNSNNLVDTVLQTSKYYYSGQSLYGKMYGSGKIRTKHWIFTGQFNNDYPDEGIVEFLDSGDIFEGKLQLHDNIQDKISGQGQILQRDGRILKGTFKRNKQIGAGCILFQDGKLLKSCFIDGLPDGFTEIQYENGNYRKGTMKAGQWIQIYEWKKGNTLIKLNLNEPKLSGTIQVINRYKYTGELNLRYQMHGKGVLIDQAGVWEGQFIKNKKHGKFQFRGTNDIVFDGIIYNDGVSGEGYINGCQRAIWIGGKLVAQ